MTERDNHRSKLEIIAEILKLAKKGVRKTRIVYGCNLNFKMLGEYLDYLMPRGLMTQEGNTLTTSSKGLKYLEGYRLIQLACNQ